MFVLDGHCAPGLDPTGLHIAVGDSADLAVQARLAHDRSDGDTRRRGQSRHREHRQLALPVLDALDDDEVETLFRALTPITRKIVATPMGLSRDDLDDDSAHVS